MSTENKPSEAAMRAARKILASGRVQNLYHGAPKPTEKVLAEIIDAELASESLEQRATAAAEEIEGNMIPIRSGQSNVIRAQKIILRHFSGLGGGNEKDSERLDWMENQVVTSNDLGGSITRQSIDAMMPQRK